MSTRLYRFFYGLALLSALLLSLPYIIYTITAILLFEGLTGWRIPILVSRIIDRQNDFPYEKDSLSKTPSSRQFNFESERLFDLVIGCILILSYIVFPQQLWFLPWFLGLAITGAGITGICPMVSLFRRIGFS